MHSGIRTRNRQYAYILVSRPLPPPSMLVLAGQNRKKALSFFFVYKRFSPPKNYFRLSPLCSNKFLSPTRAPCLGDIARYSGLQNISIRYQNTCYSEIIFDVISPENGAIATHILVSDRNIFFKKNTQRYLLDQAHMFVKGLLLSAIQRSYRKIARFGRN